MDLKLLEDVAFQQMGNRSEIHSREPGWLYYHGVRTAKIARHLSDAFKFDGNNDIIYAGALFHDIGKGSEQHNIRGAEMVRTLLASECGDMAELNAICQIVELHNQRGNTEQYPLSVRIVQDADVLDHVGPIASWLSFYWSGAHNETMHDHVNFISGEQNSACRKARRGSLNFDISRELFDERIKWEDEMLGTVRDVYFNGTITGQ